MASLRRRSASWTWWAVGPGQDDRPFLLFDLNGTLTSHTHKRQSSGINLMRPGIHHLMQPAGKPLST